MNEKSIQLGPYEVARQSPASFFSKADEARYVAYCLWQAKSDPPSGPDLDDDLHHQVKALLWGFMRESSLALELISKAVFAKNQMGADLPNPVPGSHNVPQLWKMAHLPALQPVQEIVLYDAWQTLTWVGRYPAPTRDDRDLYPEVDRVHKQAASAKRDTESPPLCRWDAFDEIYQIASRVFFDAGMT
ncbi:hypothetical protein [Sphingobium yanoikuyae]|uniref:hypothetical protein n=1 Tax=Sphingobium yanoikuyae TaxID=13690 RepID=UPI0019D1A0ED|nr:hypothetical protein [Sphingobium yanoikuyae]